MYFRPTKSYKKLDELISYTRQIILVINKEHSIDDKFPYILKYFCYITSPKNIEFIKYCVKNRISSAIQFSKFNVQFVDTLYKDIILSGYYEKNKYPIITIVEFSEQLTNISDMYGVSVYEFDEYK